MSDLKIFTENIEHEALNQIYTLIKQPAFADCKVRIMPDVHAGAGCVIGFTADLGDKVIPNIVGVDIGCGMLTVELGKIEIDLAQIDNIIREFVPSGRNVHEGRVVRFDRLQQLRCFRELKDTKRLERSIGTLGGGNHFIEIDTDSEGTKYLIIHTGSRNLGKQVAEHYQNLAVEIMQGKDKLYEMQEQLIADYKAQGRKSEIQKAIKELHRKFNPNPLGIPKELCYLTGKYREDYLHDMAICQHFASINRYEIANAIVGNLFGTDIAYWGLPMFETIHNYIEFGTNMVRKGAISAKAGERLLIPINMRDGCIIGIGKGNEDWNCSAPHGAGRIMSRSKAKEVISLVEFEESMRGIYTTSVGQSTIDESPMVYKPIDEIVTNIQGTVEIEKIIKPIYNFKASE
jgi:RNA-splicing ligase RtcB